MPTQEAQDRRNRIIKRSFIILTVLFFLTLAGLVWVIMDVRDLSERTAKLAKVNTALVLENRIRIDEIQNSRVESCKQTYRSIQDVFKPFSAPKPRTKEQQDLIDKFNQTIAKFIKKCAEQTRPKKADN